MIKDYQLQRKPVPARQLTIPKRGNPQQNCLQQIKQSSEVRSIRRKYEDGELHEEERILRKLMNIQNELKTIPNWEKYADRILFNRSIATPIPTQRSHSSNRNSNKKDHSTEQTKLLQNSVISFEIKHTSSIERSQGERRMAKYSDYQIKEFEMDNGSASHHQSSNGRGKGNDKRVDEKINEIDKKIRQFQMKKKQLNIDYTPFTKNDNNGSRNTRNTKEKPLEQYYRSKTPTCNVNQVKKASDFINNSNQKLKILARPPKYNLKVQRDNRDGDGGKGRSRDGDGGKCKGRDGDIRDREIKSIRDTRDIRDRDRDTRNIKQTRDIMDIRDTRDTRDIRDRDIRDTRDMRDIHNINNINNINNIRNSSNFEQLMSCNNNSPKFSVTFSKNLPLYSNQQMSSFFQQQQQQRKSYRKQSADLYRIKKEKNPISFALPQKCSNGSSVIEKQQQWLFNYSKEEVITKKPSNAIKKLVSALTEQVKLDQNYRNCKLWLKSYKNDKKWQRLQSLMELESMSPPSIEELQKQFEISEIQQNPFYSVTTQSSDLEEVARSFIKAEKYWQSCILRRMKREELKGENFTIGSIDLDKKGHIVLEDLVRFMNMQTGTFFRNRDMYTIFRRFCRNENKISFDSFMRVLCG